MAQGIVRPSDEEIAAARGRIVPDVLAPGLDVVFCGINPGLYSGAVGHHFARPGNRFWKALHLGGFTPRILDPSEDVTLPRIGCGITNLVARATVRASEVGSGELHEGARRLEAMCDAFTPKIVAVLGIGAFRVAFREPRASPGRAGRELGPSILWVLPNPSGLNAHHQLDNLGRRFAEVRRAARSAPHHGL